MSTAIQVMIVEDEQIVALDLSMGLQQDGYEVAGIADSFEEAVDLFQNKPVDIILMDVHIHGEKDGITCAEAILKIREVPIIYLTAFSDSTTVERVKQTKAAAFLTKPYSLANVRVAIEIAMHNFAVAHIPAAGGRIVPMQESGSAPDKKGELSQLVVMNDIIFLKQGTRFVKMKLAELMYAESENNYVSVVTKTQKLTLRMSLSDLLDQIQFPALVRIHRSYAVNINEINSFDEQTVKTDKLEIPIGRNYKEAFFRHFRLK